MKPLLLSILFLIASQTGAAQSEPLAVGVIADCQYADQNHKGQRLYRSCPDKLQHAAEVFNQQPLDHVVHLGDFIDKDWRSFAPLVKITNTLNAPVFHVLGNHDLEVADDKKAQVTTALNMPSRYYSLQRGAWRFIAVDGNDVSTYGWPKSSPEHQRNLKLYQQRYAGLATWNGGIGDKQLNWIEEQLRQAKNAQQQVVFYCHFPIFPDDPHNLWNADELLALIDRYPNVVAWINGHNHKGNYGKRRGVHYLNLHGMLDTEQTAFSVLTLTDTEIRVKGYGRQPSLRLPLN
ncbi:metallophosphoesterase [Ferrimonas aestuarii]|uniref:Calcineurin-like phosphoesterase domain-containing protein n=1 Tax=Ferrimonas aestuarii TaxID=2569539 RepID=A0A4U1BLZ2_9GAMM|nr:metallophosphoesterase [Ferrimonas aestuarii]TKB51688.1 hypothetical protein FCL42_17770 [Ferrimonas aestuarii]